MTRRDKMKKMWTSISSQIVSEAILLESVITNKMYI